MTQSTHVEEEAMDLIRQVQAKLELDTGNRPTQADVITALLQEHDADRDTIASIVNRHR